MFFRHVRQPTDTCATLPPKTDYPHEPSLEGRIVSCQDCKHLLYKKDAQAVRCVTIGRHWLGAGGDRWEKDIETVSYYCPACRKSYDHVQYNRATAQVRYFRAVPAIPARLEEVFPDETEVPGQQPSVGYREV